MGSADGYEGIWSLCADCMDRPFLIDVPTARTYTYRRFFRETCSLVSFLQGCGIRPGDRIAVLMPNCAEYPVIYFAGLSMGCVIVPISCSIPHADVQFLMQHCGAKWLAISPNTPPPLLEGIDTPRMVLGGEDWALGATESPLLLQSGSWREPNSEALSTIHFTSGTTERPKGVAHKLSSLIGSAKDFNEMLGFGAHTRMFHLLSMAHMAGFLNSLLCPFLAGGSVVVGQTFTPQLVLSFWNVPRKYGVNTLWIAPAIAASLVRLDRDTEGVEFCRKYVEAVCVGTAPLSDNTKWQFEEKYGVKLFESYGLSETLFNATNSPKFPCRANSVGKTIPSTHVKITAIPDGEIQGRREGEILLRTPYAMIGYLDYESGEPLTSSSPEWFSTGDAGYVDDDGYLYITGRKKDLIIRGGVNISPRRIERVIEEHGSVQQAAVVGVPDPFWGESVVAVVLLMEGEYLDEVRDELVGICRDGLAESEVPARWFQFDSLPLSSTGKVQKSKLREDVAARLSIREVER